jgi:hypothetical protein
MKLHYSGLAFSTLFFMACGAVSTEAEQSSPQEEEEVAETAQALRSCTSNLNCAGGCECTMGYCGPDGFSPPTPQAICDAPPQRHCSSQADCVTGCTCVSNSCAYSGFSPPINCLASPPDGFESDDTHQTASSYLGTPQLKHTFHRLGDVDWILVATPANQVMTVDAYNLVASTLGNFPQIRIEIYNYNYANRSLGTLIGSTQSLICNNITPACFVFRATANVTAGSVYAVKVIDRRTGPLNNYDVAGPSYDLKMY